MTMSDMIDEIIYVLRNVITRYSQAPNYVNLPFLIDYYRYKWWLEHYKKATFIPLNEAFNDDKSFKENYDQARYSRSIPQEIMMEKASWGRYTWNPDHNSFNNCRDGDLFGKDYNIDLKVGTKADRLATINLSVYKYAGKGANKPHFIVDTCLSAKRALIIEVSKFRELINENDFNDEGYLEASVIEDKLKDYIFNI